MEVDYAKCWYALIRYVEGKPSHGRRDLHAEMAVIEARYQVPEGQEGFDPRPPLRRIDRPAQSTPRVVPSDGAATATR